jgi:hypothetical protein
VILPKIRFPPLKGRIRKKAVILQPDLSFQCDRFVLCEKPGRITPDEDVTV